MESKRFAIYTSEESRIFHELKDYFSDNAWEKEVIHCESEGMETAVIVVERYFMRNNSTATATYTIVRERGKVQIIIVASGAGTGIFNFSLGALTQIIIDAQEKLLELGFEEIK